METRWLEDEPLEGWEHDDRGGRWPFGLDRMTNVRRESDLGGLALTIEMMQDVYRYDADESPAMGLLARKFGVGAPLPPPTWRDRLRWRINGWRSRLASWIDPYPPEGW